MEDNGHKQTKEDTWVAQKTDDGVATLTGTVESWSEYYAAANNAYNAVDAS